MALYISSPEFKLAPILLFTYNRYDHTKRTVDALQKNTLAPKSELFIYSDGPKNRKDDKLVKKVRRYLQSLTGFSKITIMAQKTNQGLARSIINGVSSVVNEYGRVIVLEDDIVTSPYFLKYMNDALDRYENTGQVMHIAAYMFPIVTEKLPETFFSRNASSWGWGTWSRAWKCFEKDIDNVSNQFSQRDICRFNLDGAHDFWRQIKLNKHGKINTWAVFWYASIFLNDGLCLNPRNSLTKNIGHDHSGMHCRKTNFFDTQLTNQEVIYFEKAIQENDLAMERLKTFFQSLPLSGILNRVIGIIRRRRS